MSSGKRPSSPEKQNDSKTKTLKKDLSEQARIYYKNLEKIVENFLKTKSQDTFVTKIQQNLNSLKETYYFLRDDKIESETIFIGFFGSPGSGKSSRINELLGEKLLPTQTVIQSQGKGCTKYPTICFVKDIDIYQLVFIKDKKETFFKSFQENDLVRKELANIMNETNDIDYIKIIVPKKTQNKSNSFLFDKNIALIDTIGVPDLNIPNAHELNAKMIMNEELDTSFILQNSSRGNLTKEYINDLFESDIFKLRKYSDKLALILLKIVSIYVPNETQENDETQEKIQLFKKIIKDNFTNEISEFLNIRSEKPLRRNNEKFKNVLLQSFDKEELKKRSESLVWNSKNGQINENTFQDMKAIINEIVQFKTKFLISKFFRKASQYNNDLFDLLRKDNKNKCRNGEIENVMYNHLYNNQNYRKFSENIQKQSENFINKIDIKSKSIHAKKEFEKYEAVIINEDDPNDKPDDDNNSLDQNEDIHNPYDKAKLNFLTEFDGLLKFFGCIYIETSKQLGKFFIKKNIINYKNEQDFKKTLIYERYDRYRSLDENFNSVIEDLLNEMRDESFGEKFLSRVKDELWAKNIRSESDISINFKLIKENLIIKKTNDHYNKTFLSFTNSFESTVRSPVLLEGQGRNVLPDLSDEFKDFLNKSITDKIKVLVKKSCTKQKKIEKNAASTWIKSKLLLQFSESIQSINEIHIRICYHDRKIEVDYNKDAIKEKMHGLSEKIRDFRTKDSFENGNIALNPIFIWLKPDTIKNNYCNVKTLLKDLTSNEGKFIVFVFVLENSDFNLNKIKKVIGFEKFQKSIVFVFIKKIQLIKESNELNAYSVKNLMILLAKDLNIRTFYHLSDDINRFYEYNHISQEMEHHSCSALRTLAYMSTVMLSGLYGDDKLSKNNEANEQEYFNKKCFEIKNFFTKCFDEELISEKENFDISNFIDNNKHERKFKLFEPLLSNLRNLNQERMSKLDESNIKTERRLLMKPYKEIEQLISGPYKTFLGEVLLLDKNKSFTDDKGQRKIDLGKINYSTHRIAKPKDFEAILYNMDAIDSLLPVQDNNFFEEKQNKNNNEDYYNYYNFKMLNLVSNYQLFQFVYDIEYKNQEEEITEKELIDMDLPLVEFKTKSSSTTDKYKNLIIKRIIKWEGFNEKIKSFYHSLNTIDKIYKLSNISFETKITKEIDLQYSILNILKCIFNEQLISDSNYEFKQQNSADISLVHKNDEKDKILNIEIKLEEVLKSIKKDDLIDNFKNNKGNAHSCVKQTYNYMIENKCDYGILTTYTRTWIFKIENDTLLISNEIELKDFLKSIYYLIKELKVNDSEFNCID